MAELPWFAMLLAFALSVGLNRLLIPVAHHVGWLDHPRGRKDHAMAVPLIGGMVMFLAFGIGALTLDQPLPGLRPLFVAAALMVLVGVLDDLHELGSAHRFSVQIGAALLMVYWGGVAATDLGGIVGGVSSPLGAWSTLFTVFATVGVINALNMSDGMDGLAAGYSVVLLVGLLSLADAASAPLLLVLLAAIAGFLVFNFPLPGRRARIFMGDAGAMFLGFVLTWFILNLADSGQGPMRPVTALWLLALPLIDAVSVMLHRPLNGRSPFAPDQRHIHHLLQHLGLSRGQSLAACLSLAGVMAAVGWLSNSRLWPEPVMFYGFLGLFVAYFGFMTVYWRTHATT